MQNAAATAVPAGAGLAIILAGALLVSLFTVAGITHTTATQSASGQGIVAIAQEIENGQAVSPWNGGPVPYAWAGGHGAKFGPSFGSCNGYTGSIHPCPAASTTGVDCSGFVRWVYATSIGRDVLDGDTSTQIHKVQPVSAEAAQPGDLVFFGSLTKPHHVGIYIGNKQMINALKTGTNVETDSISMSDFIGFYHYAG